MAKVKFWTFGEEKTKRFVEHLAAQGLSAKEIAVKFKKRFGLTLHYGDDFANDTMKNHFEKETIEVECKE